MRIYRNCKVITLNESQLGIDSQSKADLIAVEMGKIAYIGEEKDCPERFDKAEVIDLKGGVVIPGFWESHLHLVDGMRSLLELNLRGCNSFEEFKARLLDYMMKMPEDEWVIGHGWDESKIFSGSFPDRKLLDSLVPAHPAIMIRMDGHSLCVNTRAIERLGLEDQKETPELPFASDGMPTGMLYEQTANNVIAQIVQGLSDSYIENLVLKAQELFISNGITSINDICTMYGRYFDIYRRLQKEGRLKLRIVASPFGSDQASVEEFDERIGEETDKLKIGPAKYFIDGSFGSRTALLFEEYADSPGSTGLQLFSSEELKGYIIENETYNKPINIHAIGDKAVSIVLDGFSSARHDNKRDVRSRIEHIQIVREADIDRFRELDITASFQPVFLYETDLTKSRLGERRLKDVYRFKSFMDAGVNVVFNSDWPYGGGDMPLKPDGSKYIGFEPLLGMHAACCLQMNSSEAVAPVEALSCYTKNAAYVNYREKELGCLAKNYFADFVVLSDDIVAKGPEAMLSTEILMTVIDGDIVYKDALYGG